MAVERRPQKTQENELREGNEEVREETGKGVDEWDAGTCWPQGTRQRQDMSPGATAALGS